MHGGEVWRSGGRVGTGNARCRTLMPWNKIWNEGAEMEYCMTSPRTSKSFHVAHT
jgi:hypothetical protein